MIRLLLQVKLLYLEMTWTCLHVMYGLLFLEEEESQVCLEAEEVGHDNHVRYCDCATTSTSSTC